MLNIEFNPIQCTSQVFKNLTAQEGFLYFVTDTKQMFLGKGGKFIDICGGINIVYGKKYIEYVDSGQTPDPNVPFVLDDLEVKEYPLVNDLILNEDGCFYKVKAVSIEDDKIETTRLTLQGTGGGGSSSGGGTGAANLRINHYGGQNRYFSAQSTKAELGIIAYSDDAANYISGIELAWDDTFASPFLTVSNLSYAMEKPYYVDIVKHLSKISTKGTRVYIRVTDKYGSTRYTYYTVFIASLQLAPVEKELFDVDSDTFDYRCSVGGSLDLDSRIIKYELYSDSALMPIYTTEYELSGTQIGQVSKNLNLASVGHGAYTLKVQMVGVVNNVEIYSNELVHKILVYRESVGTAIFSALVPELTEQYTPFTISYLLAYGNSTKAYTVDIIIDNEVITSQSVYAGEVNSYTLSFETQGSYLLKLAINELGVTYEDTLEIVKYTGELPVINIDRDDLKVYLTAKGRTNNAIDRSVWPDTRDSTKKAILENFYFRSVNGWMVDDDGVDYLKVTQGGTVYLDSYTPYVDVKTKGMTIELDFMLDGIFDYDAHFIDCLSYYGDGSIKTGFAVKGDTFKYYASGKELLSMNLVEGKRIKLAFVVEPESEEKYPMCYTFLDGIISNVFNYLSDDDFNNNPQNPGYLRISSEGGQVNIYNIRMYNTALDEQNVLNNYQATIGSLAERQKSYESNLIRDVYGVIDLEAIEAESYNLQIPYVKIYGGYGADKKFKMAQQSSSNTPNLPVGKKDYRSIDISIHYPKAHQNSYFSEYKDFDVTTIFEDASLNVTNGFGQTPIEGAIMYAQGTSSLEYPVKNLRVKLKGKKFTVRPDIAPVELVTFKADFMESAGAHNTGAANYIDDAYKSVDIATPGQKHYEDDAEAGTIVTCIKGHPCVIFWNPGVDKDGNVLSKDDPKNYQYIGKYNFNLDKATPEPFGFMPDEKDDKFSYEVDADDNLVLNDKGEKINSVYCFEFLDNNEKVCNFLSDETSQSLTHEDGTPYTEAEKYYDSWYSNRINEDKEVVPGWCMGFESRHPEDKVGLHDADALWPLASWINELHTLSQTDPETAHKRFKDEYQGYLDKEFLLAYYLITEVLLMADSRVKNMMIATWGKEHRSWVDSDGEARTSFGYIWYPIFYDMDTMLGLDNIGYVNKFYYDEDTNPDVFNGDDVLWTLVRESLGNELALEYNRYEQSTDKSFTAPKIIPYFNENQATMANETFYNEDAFYKYIDTFRKGYTNHLTGEAVLPGKSTRLYAAQGNRAMAREFFIENRIRYLRGKYESTNYQEGDRIEFRLTYPKEVIAQGDYVLTDEDKKINASIKAVPPSGDFDYVSLKTGYAGVKVGVNSKNWRFVGEEAKTLTVDTTSGNGTETYLFGISNLADIGDLSNKYLYMLIVGAAQNNLKKLILGNHHKDYYNPYWGSDSIELTGFRFLEEFNLENCATFSGGVDFSDCPQIKKILLNGSNPRSVTLPIGGVIEELRIPDSLTTFAIDTHPGLTDEKFTIGYYDYDANKYVNNYKNLVNLSLKGVPLVDTYKIARGALFQTPLKLETYAFQEVNWVLNAEDDFTYSESGNISGIRALDILHSSLAPYKDVKTESEALTGTLTVALAGKTVNEFDIYQKYHFIYPNLKIVYADGVSVQPASEIKFYNLETITDSTEPYYTVLSNGEYTLEFLTSKEGPAGAVLQPPVKVPTATESFTFAYAWNDLNGNMYLDSSAPYIRKDVDNVSGIPVSPIENPEEEGKFYLYTITNADGTVEEYIVENNAIKRVYSFEKTVPTVPLLQLTPIFNASTRIYTISYYSDTKESLGSYNYTYQQKLSDNANAPIYFNKDDSGLEPNMRYTFVGWINEKDFENAVSNPTYIDEETFQVTYDMKLFARCVEEDCTKIATDWKYFNFVEVKVPDYNKVIFTNPSGYVPNNAVSSTNADISIGTKWSISIKEKYRKHLGGKVTIPTYTDSSRQHPVEIINDMSNMDLMTEVFFLDDSLCIGTYPAASGKGFYHTDVLKAVHFQKEFKYLGYAAFNLSGIKTVDFPADSKLEYIGNRAFGNCSNLEITSLPDTVNYLGESAFYNSPNLALTSLPLGLTQIRESVFMNCYGMKVNTFGRTVGNVELGATENNIELICHDAFNGVGNNVGITEIHLKDSVKSIGNSAFYMFGDVSQELLVEDNTGIIRDKYDTNGVAIEAQVFGSRRISYVD